MVVANSLSAAREGASAVFYSRASGAYQIPPYSPPWLTPKILRPIIDRLVAEKFLVATIAPRGPSVPYSSTFGPARKLLDGLSGLGISANQRVFSGDAPVLYLKDADGGLRPYEPGDPELVQLAEPIRAYNSFLKDHSLALAASPEELATLKRPINFSRTTLKRIFNRGSWDKGGRLYGGWWIETPGALRSKIEIDSEPTVELDYQAMWPRMAYHRLGRQYEGDPYDIIEVRQAAERQGVDWHGNVRDSVKLVMLTMLNAKSRKGRPKTLNTAPLPSGVTVTDVQKAILKQHQALKGSFFTELSLKMMRQDSDVAVAVISDGVQEGIPVLPVHDSFLVRARDRSWLEASMERNYQTIFKFDPVVC